MQQATKRLKRCFPNSKAKQQAQRSPFFKSKVQRTSSPNGSKNPSSMNNPLGPGQYEISFPLVKSSFQTIDKGNNAFIIKFNRNASPMFRSLSPRFDYQKQKYQKNQNQNQNQNQKFVFDYFDNTKSIDTSASIPTTTRMYNNNNIKIQPIKKNHREKRSQSSLLDKYLLDTNNHNNQHSSPSFVLGSATDDITKIDNKIIESDSKPKSAFKRYNSSFQKQYIFKEEDNNSQSQSQSQQNQKNNKNKNNNNNASSSPYSQQQQQQQIKTFKSNPNPNSKYKQALLSSETNPEKSGQFSSSQQQLKVTFSKDITQLTGSVAVATANKLQQTPPSLHHNNRVKSINFNKDLKLIRKREKQIHKPAKPTLSTFKEKLLQRRQKQTYSNMNFSNNEIVNHMPQRLHKKEPQIILDKRFHSVRYIDSNSARTTQWSKYKDFRRFFDLENKLQSPGPGAYRLEKIHHRNQQLLANQSWQFNSKSQRNHSSLSIQQTNYQSQSLSKMSKQHQQLQKQLSQFKINEKEKTKKDLYMSRKRHNPGIFNFHNLGNHQNVCCSDSLFSSKAEQKVSDINLNLIAINLRDID